MGSTVSIAKKVAAYADRAGRPIYVLLESTYEKNCYPHTPRWSAVGFGRATTVIDRIFGLASETCGGMLQGPGGRIQPTSYVRGWLDALAVPHVFRCGSASLEVRERGLAGTIPADKAEAVLSAMTQSGHGDVATRLSTGKRVDLSFVEDAEALLVIATIVASWRFIGHVFDPSREPAAASLGYRPERSAVAPSVSYPGVFRLQTESQRTGIEEIVVMRDGRLMIGEPEYRLMGDCVESYAPLERSHPGYFARYYRGLKAHIEALPILPFSTIVQIDPVKASPGWAKYAAEAAQKIGPMGKTIGEIAADRGLLYAITGSREAVTLTLPDEACEGAELLRV